jgi:hypothetical protein
VHPPHCQCSYHTAAVVQRWCSRKHHVTTCIQAAVYALVNIHSALGCRQSHPAQPQSLLPAASNHLLPVHKVVRTTLMLCEHAEHLLAVPAGAAACHAKTVVPAALHVVLCHSDSANTAAPRRLPLPLPCCARPRHAARRRGACQRLRLCHPPAKVPPCPCCWFSMPLHDAAAATQGARAPQNDT